jgi:hypothetical protein
MIHSIKILLATILTIILSAYISEFSFKYHWNIHKISQYYAVLAYPLLLISFIATAVISLLREYPKFRQPFIALQHTILLILIIIFVLGFFR